MSDKKPLRERSTAELEEGLAKDLFGSRDSHKYRDAWIELNKRRRLDAAGQRGSGEMGQTWGIVAEWAGVAVVVVALAWLIFKFFAAE
jgi:hypothetical protein